MRRRIEVKAVWDSDLENLLASLGLIDEQGHCRQNCTVCSRKLDMEAVGAIVSGEDGAKLICDDTICLQRTSALDGRLKDV